LKDGGFGNARNLDNDIRGTIYAYRPTVDVKSHTDEIKNFMYIGSCRRSILAYIGQRSEVGGLSTDLYCRC
jgi:hypothetical protein